MKQPTLSQLPIWIRYVAIALLVIGIVFRFVNLNHKVLWHDEVYTGFRSAGYVAPEIWNDLAQNQPIQMQRLKDYTSLKPNSNFGDTLHSLVAEDSQHPPLFFMMTRLWMQVLGSPIRSLFGSQITVLRSLPMLLSLLAIPAAFALAWELFHSKAAALFAAMLLALSPLDVLFAQTARQYSLLTVVVLVSQWLLMRALRLSQPKPQNHQQSQAYSQWQPWLWYSFAVAIGLYTHPFFGLTIAAQIVLVSALWLSDRAQTARVVIKFAGAVLLAIVAFTPWLIVIYRGLGKVSASTDWLKITPPIKEYFRQWILNYTSLFYDLELGLNNPLDYLIRLLFIALIGVAVILVCRQCDRRAWLSVLTIIFVPLLLLAGADLALGGKRSTIGRYLISSYPGVQLAVAWLLATLCSRGLPKLRLLYKKSAPSINRLVMGVTAFSIIALSTVASLTASAAAFTWWTKDVSYYNNEIAQVINQTNSPLIVSDHGNSFTNLGDLISISYLVKPEVPVVYFGDDLDYINRPEFAKLQVEHSIIFFRPTKALQDQLEATFRNLQPHSKPELKLWTLAK
ncbi:MAG TPA: glycosyltransferase family 39 protein [Leptolyngbyaceae cyanobacterium M33_DOE_097]|uniref:Glycosyl transferase family 39 n=1 Tax=Oscillatoriales cyanobacterium SpSt-418 TaxID=2282169 RepID=A0A7C3PHV7_9CYAN|nr:glycosyltransferase family 39 protein [Leptolyngbyaceae cyanobacterium M33_DOE_097]